MREFFAGLRSDDELAGIKVGRSVVYLEYILGVNSRIVMEILAEIWKFCFSAKVLLKPYTGTQLSSKIKESCRVIYESAIERGSS